MKLQRNVLLTAFFGVLCIVATISVVSLEQTPAKAKAMTIVGSYMSTASYDYTAYVESSLVYGNKTVLKPQDGVIYTNLADKIDLTLTYSFNASVEALPHIVYFLNETLMTDSWQHSLISTPATTTQQTTIEVLLPSFQRQQIEETKALIDQETGATTGTYSVNSDPYYVLEIAPTFQVEATTKTGQIHQIFQPTLIINVTKTSDGSIIKIGPLIKTSSGSVTQEQTVTDGNLMNQRYASYIFAVCSFGGLSYMAVNLRKQKTAAPATQSVDKRLQPYRHLIVEATENTDSASNVIRVADVGELAKAAETLARPILHVKNASEDCLYVIEGNTKYVYTIMQTEPTDKNR